MSTPNHDGWIGVDLDGTLAQYNGWIGLHHVGEPVPAMLDRVKAWLAQGKRVKIFTARMAGHDLPDYSNPTNVERTDAVTPIRQWCLKHLGQVLEVTNVKDFGMIELWDDRCVQVTVNTGVPVASSKDRKRYIPCHD